MQSLCCKIYRPVNYSMSHVGHLHHRLIKKRYRLFRYLLLVCVYSAVAFLVSLQAAGCFEFFDSIGFLPGEVGVFAAEVTVGCRLFVNRATQV